MTRWMSAAALGLAIAAAPAWAHHAISAVYDSSKRVTVEGAVREFQFINPASDSDHQRHRRWQDARVAARDGQPLRADQRGHERRHAEARRSRRRNRQPVAHGAAESLSHAPRSTGRRLPLRADRRQPSRTPGALLNSTPNTQRPSPNYSQHPNDTRPAHAHSENNHPRARGRSLAWLGQAQGQQTRTAAETWNDEYRGKAERGFTFTPNSFLASFTEKLKPGTAVDIAMGQGRNALMLAERGWDVTGFDISDVAVAQAEAQAKARGDEVQRRRCGRRHLRLRSTIGGTWWFLSMQGLRDSTTCSESLRPGGVWVVEAFHRDAFGGGFRDNQLVDIFRERMTVLYYEDSIGRPDLTWIYPPKDFRYVRSAACGRAAQK